MSFISFYSLIEGRSSRLSSILFILQNIYKLLSIIETVCYTANGYFRIPLYNFSLTLYTPTM
nr:MAG TPA: hypothetical protein [Caudoviricetes sp.]DAI46304.1 MAG TPA: hypothetical protein [Caudoviricetes sp.]DAK87636.1 MAG TPA: hypothetical protein [Bacteriophage sp.]DAV23385.1 MAG TPA: hypothetical protein [Bacteriophage sp.]